MINSIKQVLRLGAPSRRELFRRGSFLLTASALGGSSVAEGRSPTTAGKMQLDANIYKSIGVRPLINCRGTYTVISGSLELPEVRAAELAASQHYVQLDELTDGIGRRLAELTGAEWGMVSGGCAAAIAHATAACVTGGNPDLLTRIPDLSGFAKDEVVIPKQSRNEYDQAVRSVGVRVVEVGTAAEFEAALGPRVAMVYILTSPRLESGPLTYDDIYKLAKEKNIPVFADAVAEMLSIPNVHLQRGATLVGYSGGKCLRGPQSAGLLLGRKDLVRAAWVCSAPHHGHGRTMKVGKEEAVGMLAAVEMWVQRDHQKEDAMWTSWMQDIANRVTKVDGVQAAIRQPAGLDNHSPELSITWSPARMGITGEEVSNMLWDQDPRIAVNGGGRRNGSQDETGISITAYMMRPDDVKPVADKIHEILSANRPAWNPENPKAPAGDIAGRWNVHVEFAAGSADHFFFVQQKDNRLVGTHQGNFVDRDLSGTISGDRVSLTSSIGEVHGAALTYHFTGTLSGDTMSGALNMGEYLGGQWTATRHMFGKSRAVAG